MKTRTTLLAFLAVVLLLAGSGFALPKYEGTVGSFLLFDVSYLLLLLLALPKPRLYTYTFLSLFLFLGFWLKFVLHTSLDYGFIEPVGGFDGTGPGWDRALVVASCAALGVALARLLHLLYSRYAQPEATSDAGRVPEWYVRYRKFIWIGTVLLLLVLNSANALAGFYQIGLGPKVVLPLHLNIVAAWLVNIGLALWISVLVYWEVSGRRGALGYVLLAPLFEGLVSAGSTLSRKAYLFHVIPYVFVLIERKLEFGSALTRWARVVLAALFVLGFVFSLVAVSVLRVYAYPPPVEAENLERSEVLTQSRVLITQQVLGLTVDRWVGLESVLAVSSYPELGYDLFTGAVQENPSLGTGSVYQKISGADALYNESLYAEPERIDFSALPGSAAVLYYSGSLLVVGFGMVIIALFIMGIEVIASRLIGNPFLLSVSGLAMVNVVSELNFPFLAGIFFVQLLIAFAFIWAVQTISTPLRDKPLREVT